MPLPHPTRRQVLAAGLATACLPAAGWAGVSSGNETSIAAPSEDILSLDVAPTLGTGSVHVMRKRGLLVLVTGPGTGRGYPLRIGSAAGRHPDDSFLELHPDTGGIALRDRTRGNLPFGIAATGAGLVLQGDHLADLAARLAPGAAGVLYA